LIVRALDLRLACHRQLQSGIAPAALALPSFPVDDREAG
jgi:hypothetical protein